MSEREEEVVVYTTRNLPLRYHKAIRLLAAKWDVTMESALNELVRRGLAATKKSGARADGG